MKYLFSLFPFFTSVLSAQDMVLRNKINKDVAFIETVSSKQSNFKFSSSTYQYKLIQGKLSKIIRVFTKSNTKTIQTFYIKNELLIFSTEYEITYYNKESIGWGGTYYFENNRLKDYETLGHGKSEIETWEPEKEVLSNYTKSKNIVLNNIKKRRN